MFTLIPHRPCYQSAWRPRVLAIPARFPNRQLGRTDLRLVSGRDSQHAKSSLGELRRVSPSVFLRLLRSNLFHQSQESTFSPR